MTVCVVAGPSASALCAGEMPPEAAPCHEAGEAMGDMPMGDMPMHHGQETGCLSACCAAPNEGVGEAVAAPVLTGAVVFASVDVKPPAVAPASAPTAARTHPPPGPTLLDTGRLRI